MAEFKNYKVEIILHDTSRIRGFVSGVEGKELTLTDGKLVPAVWSA